MIFVHMTDTGVMLHLAVWGTLAGWFFMWLFSKLRKIIKK